MFFRASDIFQHGPLGYFSFLLLLFVICLIKYQISFIN